jgi:hypothetical protein
MARIPRDLIRHLEWKPGDPEPETPIVLQTCIAVSALSARLADWQREQAAVGEESMTDWLLFELASRIPTMRYQKFSRHREARETGADWEWWFVFDDGVFGARVQAKRIKPKEDNYPSLAYANQYGLQIEMLRADAAKNHLPAFYLIYSPGNLGSPLLCAGAVPHRDSGAFLASATDFYRSFIEPGRCVVSDTQILSRSNPIECVACCPVNAGSTLQGLRMYLRRYYSSEAGIDENQDIGFRSALPWYATRVLSRDLLSDAQGENSAVPVLSGVAVIDVRGA